MLSIFGDALSAATRREPHRPHREPAMHADRITDWDGRFTPPRGQEEERPRFSVKRDLFW